jgi:hypothetical protein
LPASLTLSVDVQRFLRNVIAKAPEVAAKQLKAVMRDIGRNFTVKVQRERLAGETTANSLGKRSGAMARSMGFTVRGAKLSDLIAFMGFGPPSKPWFGGAEAYAHVHETGAVIEAVNQEFLAIPSGDNLTPAGLANVQSPRDLADPRFVPWHFSDGEGFLVFDQALLMFVLKREVEIPPRLHFADDWENFQDDIMVMMRVGLTKMLKRIEKGRG